MLNKTRIYDDKVDIDNTEVKSFFEKRASIKDLTSVLLGNQKDSKHSDLRNIKELTLLKSFINDFKDLSVLDIGCGMGRWANNLKNEIRLYHGIDFSENFVSLNKEQYKNYNNIKFMLMSASDMDLSKLDSSYDLIIIKGVLMYVNDDKLGDIFCNLKILSPHYIYIKESISILNDRLTLKIAKKNYIFSKIEYYKEFLFPSLFPIPKISLTTFSSANILIKSIILIVPLKVNLVLSFFS